MTAPVIDAGVVERKLEHLFVAQVRKIDDALGDIVQGHLDQGYSLATVQAMLKDATRIAQAVRK